MSDSNKSSQNYTISFVSSEVAPFSKTGGLGDVAGQLPFEIDHSVSHIHIITPLYGMIDQDYWDIRPLYTDVKVRVTKQRKVVFDFYYTVHNGLYIYFVDVPQYFSEIEAMYLGGEEAKQNNMRFFLFNIGVLKLLEELEMYPDLIHCNDWHTGVLPNLIARKYNGFNWKQRFEETKVLFTIHNLYFQSGTPEEYINANDDGHSRLPRLSETRKLRNLNFAKRGIIYANAINAVSPHYAEEIMQPKFGEELHTILKNRKHKVFGILNGIDNNEYNPATDPGLACQYTGDTSDYKEQNKRYLQEQFGLKQTPRIPVIAMVTRITEQKGIDLIQEILPHLLQRSVQFIILGEGEKHYETFFKKISNKNTEKMYAQFEFDATQETQILAGSDIFLMPSRFEPAGLGQLKSLRYGCIP
ncbi:MAG: glycogen synthase, partial [Candidatus Paceibacteria bacterium]